LLYGLPVLFDALFNSYKKLRISCINNSSGVNLEKIVEDQVIMLQKKRRPVAPLACHYLLQAEHAAQEYRSSSSPVITAPGRSSKPTRRYYSSILPVLSQRIQNRNVHFCKIKNPPYR
jgi:hypothetical protein